MPSSPRLLALLAVLALTPALRADPPASPDKNPDPSRYLFEDAIKPGMKGYGLTCLTGGKIEKFQIEVVDVMKNYAPGSNAILIRCSGLNLEHSGVIAGMSGSPVFIDGKMIGALAFDWPLAKDPIAGVQPIRQMLAIPAKKTDTRPASEPAAGGSGWRSNKSLTAAGAKLPGYGAIIESLAAREPAPRKSAWTASSRTSPKSPTLQPIAAPMMLSSASSQSLAFLRDALEGTSLVPVASGAAGSASGPHQLGGAADVKPGQIKLEPGSSISIPVISGDMDLSAMGTVTEVRDGKIYAFGHAMFADGATNLPIATGYIYTTMPHLAQSFKLGSSLEHVGSLIADEQTGIVGTLGPRPRAVPIKLRVHSADGSLDRTYNYQMARHPRLTSPILGMILIETLTAQRALPSKYTARITGAVKFENATLDLDLMGTSQGFHVTEAVMPIALLADNPFKNLPLESIELDARIEPVDRSIEVKSVSVPRLTAAPGDEITATVELIPFHQKSSKVAISIKIPKETPEGDYDLCVGGAEMVLGQEVAEFPHRFEPENIDTLVSAVKNVLAYKKDKLYARLVLDVAGAAQKGREYKNIPPSKLALYSSDKRSNTAPVRNAVLSTVDVPGSVIDGGQTLTITIHKDANKRFFSAKPADHREPLFPLGNPRLPKDHEPMPNEKENPDPFSDH